MSPNPSAGRFTRSNPQSLLHCSRSARARLGRTPPFQQKHHQQSHSMGGGHLVVNPRKMDQMFHGIDASPCVSVQTKCSGRARSQVRVSTILSSNGLVVERESDESVFEKEFSGKGCPSKGLESDVDLDLGFKSVDLGISDKDLVPVLMDSDDKNGCAVDKRNAPKAVKKSGRVFKAPASLNYRRLLPFLTEMANNDSSTPCNTQNVDIPETSLPSDIVTCGAAHHANARGNTEKGIQLEEKDSQDTAFQPPVVVCDLEEPPNHSTQTKGLNEAVFMADETKNSNNGIEDFAEDIFQTTPPDATILSNFGIDGKRELGERKTPYEYRLFGLKSSNITCKEYACDAGNSQQSASQKLYSSPKTKPILNRCSQVKIFKSSSFSYRRLLPYLMDVSKGASYIHQSPKLENDSMISSESPSSVDKIRHTDLKKEVHAEKQGSNVSSAPLDALLSGPLDASVDALLSAPVDVSSGPVDASSANISSENLNPLASSSNSATGGTNVTSETAIVESDMQLCVQLEQTEKDEAFTSKPDLLLPFHSETEMQHKKRKLKHSEPNFSVETFSSNTKSELLSVDPISKVSQHQPENGCCLLESATSNNGLLLGERSDLYYTQNHSHMKGILKRNPRGCRGLCNCLKCSSFRLHAEKSFEFSRNQLLDAEELAFGLIDELATLRNLLEKNIGDGCDVAVIKCNQLQAKEACEQALIREQIAKQQLTQMNEELNVHCRNAPLLRPCVTFSERIEERVFTKET